MNDTIKSMRQVVGQDYVRPDINKIAAYREELQNHREALDYLHFERGFSDDTIAHFQLGYNTAHNSISIPIFKDSELIDVKYRNLNKEGAKYVRESGTETWLYNDEGVQHGMAKGSILVVEGEFDLMSAWQRGIKNVISPASGKDSYGVWIELLDNIPKVFLAYDNDEGGRSTSLKIAERLGLDKCREVVYPDGYKDANDYFKDYDLNDFKELSRASKPYYTHQFKDLGSIIKTIRTKDNDTVSIDIVPKVKIEKDWLIIISGKSNIGKTSYALNVADRLAQKDIPTLVMPFERGIESVGKRFLQVRFDKTLEDFSFLNDDEWNVIIKDCIDLPVYFALPKKSEIIDTIVKARRIFDTRFVIIDHLDYIVRNSNVNKESEIAETLQTLKTVAEEFGIVIIIVTHIRKIETAGGEATRNPNIEDLKGSSSLYQDPECVIMLTDAGEEQLNVDILKNKGEMSSGIFQFSYATGKMGDMQAEF